ncbi:MAG: HAMP domain-containing protein [Deltaproteobacteria bacterium]|nr:HAMP domain-containing protein [Deltaproteobacteria bacterium]
MRYTLGIRAQLIAGIVLTTLAGIGLIGILSIKIVENSAVYSKAREAGSIARFASLSSRLAAPLNDPSAPVRSIGAVLKGYGVSDFRVVDASGKVLSKEGVLPIEAGERLPYAGDMTIRKAGVGFLKGPGEALLITAPLSAPGRATLEFSMPLGGIKEEMAGIKRFLLLYAALDSVVIIVFGVFFLSRSIVSPISKLTDAAMRISGGDLSERAEVAADNEIGSLASSFNIMADRLEDEIKSLERVNKELVTAQEELLRSSTLAVVGRLAAGIAHEIGNPLGAVRGYLDILSRGLPDRDEEKEIVERTIKEVSRIDFIVREFLEVSRPALRSSGAVDVNRLLEETVSTITVHRDLSGIEIRTALNEGLPPVVMDERKLRQVFMNLLVNAAHSFEGKAQSRSNDRLITIESGLFKKQIERPRVRRRRGDTPLTAPPEIEDREFVFIRFTDTGAGISGEGAGRIFEPFYTTKAPGQGTGLGLFVSQSIIKAYGGEITLHTKEGEGSSFTVLLPPGEGHEDTHNR